MVFESLREGWPARLWEWGFGSLPVGGKNRGDEPATPFSLDEGPPLSLEGGLAVGGEAMLDTQGGFRLLTKANGSY